MEPLCCKLGPLVTGSLNCATLTRVQAASFTFNLGQKEELCEHSTKVHYVSDVGVWEKLD